MPTAQTSTSVDKKVSDAKKSVGSSTERASERKTVVIVGAGLGGVVLAARLISLDKYNVLILEKNASAGGRLSSISHKGYRFDVSGSGALVWPEVIESAFHDLGVEPSEILDLIPSGPSREFVFGDGTRFALTDDKEKLRASLETLEGKAGGQDAWSKYQAFLKEGKTNYDAVTQDLLYVDWAVSPLTPIKLRFLPLIAQTRFLRSLSTFYGRITSHFKSPYVQQALGTTSLFDVGQSPFDALGTYTALPYGEVTQGALYPRGGTQSVIDAFVKLATAKGAKFQFNTSVARAVPNLKFPGRMTGVELDSGEFIAADAIVSNADTVWTYATLLPKSDTTLSMLDLAFGPSSITFFWGLKAKLPGLTQAHTVFLPDPETKDSWKKALDAVTAINSVDPKTPLFLVDALTRLDPSAAPEKKEALVITVPSGNLPGSGQRGIAANGPQLLGVIDLVRKLVLERLEAELGQSDLKNLIEVEDVYSPLIWRSRYNAWRGNTLGIQPSWLQSLYCRPATQHKHYRNFFFTGASVQPGNIPPAIVAGTRTLSNKIDRFLQGKDVSYRREYIAAYVLLTLFGWVVVLILSLSPDREGDMEGFARAIVEDERKSASKALAKASASVAKSASRVSASASKAAVKAAGTYTGWF